MNPFTALYRRLPASTRSRLRSWLPRSLLRWYARWKTDVYLVSYPKCGRTWLRMMLGKAIALHFSLPEPMAEEGMLTLRWEGANRPGLPRISVVHDDRPMLKAPEELETNKGRYRDKKVIFLVRDPRDVVVSSYFEMSKRGQLFGRNPYESRQAVFEGSLEEFAHRRTGGIATILKYYNIWEANRHIPKDFLLVRYEDMQRDAASELRRALDFIGLKEVSETTVSEAVTFASFDNMRRMEKEGRFPSGILRPADPNDPTSFKTRKGKVGGYEEHLSQPEIEYLTNRIRHELSGYFGYENKNDYEEK